MEQLAFPSIPPSESESAFDVCAQFILPGHDRRYNCPQYTWQMMQYGRPMEITLGVLTDKPGQTDRRLLELQNLICIQTIRIDAAYYSSPASA